MTRITNLISSFLFALILFSSSIAHAKEESVNKHDGIEVVVNINEAGAEELKTLLIGVGNSKAQAIVDYRKVNGKFAAVDDLSNVKGIGAKLVEKNRSRIIL
ncbi:MULTISPECIES: ComEA family DNA-binding protein [Aliivibrio]|jgi:competence protein ComEA|uniref:Transporter n=1 Tax=Aliivibrio sifiae TaxID=566293 RepID=A0A2S7XBE0_9GAMM|nr:helix-hairpin-helix domain-containing protein [Aliivibrio sifiae]PQJ88673.1 transporter [Aliivibrio sifiae]